MILREKNKDIWTVKRAFLAIHKSSCLCKFTLRQSCKGCIYKKICHDIFYRGLYDDLIVLDKVTPFSLLYCFARRCEQFNRNIEDLLNYLSKGGKINNLEDG